VQTCSICHTQAPDTALSCGNCQNDLRQYSVSAMALKKLQENERVQYIRLAVASDCCPACRIAERTYKKNETPSLPVPGCSHHLGCRCFYQPVLNEIYP
jgi:hypothetical protein